MLQSILYEKRTKSFRSKSAEKYDPAVERHSWILKSQTSLDELKKEIIQNCPISFEKLESIIWHGGFFYKKKRCSQENLPPFFEKDSPIEIYYFLKEPEDIALSENMILYEDNNFLGIDKPAWLPVHGTRTSFRFSLEEKLRVYLKNQNLVAVHRLDRQTTGVCLFSKNKQATAWMQKQFKERRLNKVYSAIVKSSVQPPEKWDVECYMSRDFRELPKVFFKVDKEKNEKSKWSQTSFRLFDSQSEIHYIEAKPLTGRTHQIRVHLAHSGFPILGDELYGGASLEVESFQLNADLLEFSNPSKAEENISIKSKQSLMSSLSRSLIS